MQEAPTEKITLSNGAHIDCVRVQPGHYVMGVQQPIMPDENYYSNKIRMETIVAISIFIFLVFIFAIWIKKSVRTKSYTFSIAGLFFVLLLASLSIKSIISINSLSNELHSHQEAFSKDMQKYENADASERPGHMVIISKSFLIAKYETTSEQYASVFGLEFDKNESGKPVSEISWDEANSFCSELSRQIGRSVSLPTEAQWEYACRGASADQSNFAPLDLHVWYVDNSLGEKQRVGMKTPNKIGLYDMLGNVWEWCIDDYSSYDADIAKDPIVVTGGNLKVIRGGSFMAPAEKCSSPTRVRVQKGERRSTIGFRIVVN